MDPTQGNDLARVCRVRVLYLVVVDQCHRFNLIIILFE